LKSSKIALIGNSCSSSNFHDRSSIVLIVPHNIVSPDMSFPTTTTTTTKARNAIPILDLAKYFSSRNDFVEELRSACHNVGFFLLCVPELADAAQHMLDETRIFFERPLEEKLTISYEHSPSFRGYMPLGLENTGGKLDYREQVEYAVEYECKCSSNKWPVYERLKGENPWPDRLQPTLRTTTLDYAARVCRVADILRDSLCLALHLDPQTALRDKFVHPKEVPHWVLKLISYPPPGEDNRSQQQGVGEHTDTNFLTLVLQDPHTGDNDDEHVEAAVLQAYSQGEWLDVPTVSSDILICNLGEQAELWSRGYFLATPHRVLVQHHNNTHNKKARISVPLFYNPILSATMEPLPEGVIEGNEKLVWERPRGYQHWKRPNNTMIPSVGENTFKSLARSHPQVFARHHADLQVLEEGRIVARETA
jgi:isopenicillin N synthase-like dioxygenase